MPSTTLGPGVTSGSTGPTAASFQWQTSLSLSPYGPDVSVLALSQCTPDCLLAHSPGGVCVFALCTPVCLLALSQCAPGAACLGALLAHFAVVAESCCCCKLLQMPATGPRSSIATRARAWQALWKLS